jgi:hypothetical protein
MAGVPSGTPHAFPQVKKQVHLGKGTRSYGWAGVLDIQHYVINLSVTCDSLVVFSRYSVSLHQ